MSEGRTNATGVSFLGALALLFIGLKLGGIIAWSWWWVLAPLWGGALLVLLLIGIMVVLALVMD